MTTSQRATPANRAARDEDLELSFVGWYDSSMDLLRGCTVTEWGLIAPVGEPQPAAPAANAQRYAGPERRRRPRPQAW
ncbi:MAG TPA: hypothetical protein VFR90_04120 [Methylibium sp.]|uniref:hypothetical protein n=1 Tax=Methylibium sp. TaxID=2067992 RepID=UPI002DC00EAE|nr:hypothetical protein [Methylibium sp.]HEU4458286.1 hypothetical protein [Methylibium sp.]